MVQKPIDLDGHRSTAGKRESEMRRRPANTQSRQNETVPPDDLGPGAPRLAEPAQSWIEVMEKWRFLLERYASSPDAMDSETQTLIQSALSDMSRLSEGEPANND